MKQIKYIRYIKVSIISIIVGLLSVCTVSAEENGYTRNIYINDKLTIRNEYLPIREKEILVPIETFGTRMGATEVIWCSNKATLSIELPFFQENRLYLSYLAGLRLTQDVNNETIYPLPERLRHIILPSYPYNSIDTPTIHENPITMVLSDKDYRMPYAVYDYELIDNQVYMGSQWLNTVFLATMIDDGRNYYINFPTEELLTKRIEELQNKLRPKTPEEALALWINGQQVRSGALQFGVLCQELQEKVLATESGWVTGVSSPSLGKATVMKAEKTKDGTVKYSIQLEEVLQGEVQDTLKQKITLKSYQKAEETYWCITGVKGDIGYSILQK